MTQEEKARAYDEALERAKEFHKSKEGIYVLAAETIFPELRESEDERIRAVILKLVLGMRKEIFTTADKLVTKPKVLAWLEKQKEQKPVEWSEEDEKIANEILDHFNTENAEWFNWFNARFKSLRPQPKQEWSDEEYGRLFDIEHYLDGTLQLSPDRKIACIDWLKSLRPSWKPSEEQMAFLKGLLGSYMTLGDKRILKSLIGDLKKLI